MTYNNIYLAETSKSYLKFLPSAHCLPSTVSSQDMAPSKKALSSALSRSSRLKA